MVDIVCFNTKFGNCIPENLFILNIVCHDIFRNFIFLDYFIIITKIILIAFIGFSYNC